MNKSSSITTALAARPLVLFGVLLSGCGASSSPGSGSGSSLTFACDVSAGTVRICTEYGGLPSADLGAQLTACETERGTASDGCSTKATTLLGECALAAITGGGVDITQKQYYYDNGGFSVHEASQACARLGGVWTALGAGAATFSCETDTAGFHFCMEYQGLALADLSKDQSMCTGIQGTAGTGCAPASLGSCTMDTTGGTVIAFYYASSGVTASQAQMGCAGSGGTWMGAP